MLVLIQAVDKPLGDKGWIPGRQRDLEIGRERNLSTEGSKMGSTTTRGSLTETISASFQVKRGDEGQKELKRIIKEGIQVKVWIFDTEKNADGTYDAEFGYAELGTHTSTYPYEGMEEISTELTVQYQLQDGVFTELPPGMADFAEYGFELPGEFTGEYTNRTKTADDENDPENP